MNLDLPDELTAEQSRWHGTPEEDLQILEQAGGVNTDGKVGYQIAVLTANGTEVARIEYYLFTAANNGYIGWLHVDEEHRRQGIGTAIRQSAVQHLLQSGATEIYSGPVSDSAKPLASAQGFVPIQDGELAGKYYVYRR